MIKHYILKAKCVGGNVSKIETCMTEHKWNQNVNMDQRQKCFEEKKSQFLSYSYICTCINQTYIIIKTHSFTAQEYSYSFKVKSLILTVHFAAARNF